MEQTDHERLTVAIFMVTYNHGKFIDQAIESVVSQVTTFKYRLFIGEDCSQDNTRERCEHWSAQYPDKITLLESKENIGIFKNANRVFEACLYSGAEYIALLEGDDFWTDSQKLEKQVSLLRQNPNAAGSYHNTIQEKKDGTKQVMFKNLPLIINQERAISKYAPFHTSSFIFKSKYYCRPDWFQKIDSIDLALFALYAQFGNLVGINEVMSHYRQHEGGHTASDEHQNNFHQRRVLLHRYIRGKIQENQLKKSNALIQFHLQEIKNKIPIAKLAVIGFLNPSKGDIEKSRFIQISLDAEIIPFTLLPNGISIFQEKKVKKWYHLRGAKWIERSLNEKFHEKIDALYIHDEKQIHLLYSLAKDWNTPIILDIDTKKKGLTIPKFKKARVYTPSDLSQENIPAYMKLSPSFLKKPNVAKNKIVIFGQSSKLEKELLSPELKGFHFHLFSSKSTDFEESEFSSSILCAVILDKDVASEIQIIQLINSGAFILAPHHTFDYSEIIQSRIIHYENEIEIPTLIKKQLPLQKNESNLRPYIEEKHNLAIHCHQINQLIEKII